MRQHYQERLQSLRTQVVTMGLSAAEMVKRATDSVIQNDPTMGRAVMQDDDLQDRLERELMQEAATILMQEGPVASDLKFLVSTLGVVGEIEKVADHAVKLSRRGIKLGGLFPSEFKVTLQELSETARQQFTNALKLYTEYSPELAAQIVQNDDLVDSGYGKARDKVLELLKQDASQAASMVRVIEIFHALEHVADHAVAIAKRIQQINEPPQVPSEEIPASDLS